MSAMFADADLLLVNQIRAVKDTLIPGKILTYVAAGRPVLVAANTASQAAQLLREADGGLVIAPEDPAALAAAAQWFSTAPADTLASFGVRNRRYAEEHLDQDRILPQEAALMLDGIAGR